MRHLFAAAVVAATLFAAACASRAGPAGPLSDDALRTLAGQPWDKAAMMGRTVELGHHHGAPVVAEYICSDVCPQYTVRIIHYELPQGTSCASVDGIEQTVGVPRAIAMLPQTFCFPKVLVAAGLHYGK